MSSEVVLVLTMVYSFAHGKSVYFEISANFSKTLFYSGGLIQTIGRGDCSNDAVYFICTNTDYAFVNWDLRTIFGQTYATSFSSNDPERTAESASLHLSTIVFNVTYNNRSSISTTLTIQRPNSLNGTRITCRGKTLVLISSLSNTSSKSLLSYSILRVIIAFVITSFCDISELKLYVTNSIPILSSIVQNTS